MAGVHGQAGDPLSLLDPTAVRRIAARLELRPTKQRGQNFVTDANTVRRIVAASGVGPDDVVLEVGPGLGSLTLGLLEVADAVVAVEIDELLAAELPTTVAERMPDGASALTVVTADALRVTALPHEPQAIIAFSRPERELRRVDQPVAILRVGAAAQNTPAGSSDPYH